VAADLWTKPNGLSRRPAYRQPINFAIYYYYSAPKLILILPSHGG